MTNQLSDYDRRVAVLMRQFKAFLKEKPQLVERDITESTELFFNKPKIKDPVDREINQLESRRKTRTLQALRENERLNIELENKRMRDELAGKETAHFDKVPEKPQMEQIKETMGFLKEVKSLLPSEGEVIDDAPFDATEFAMQEGIPILRDFLAAKMMNAQTSGDYSKSDIQNRMDIIEPNYPNIEVKENDIEQISRRVEELPKTTSNDTPKDTSEHRDHKRDIGHTPKVETPEVKETSL